MTLELKELGAVSAILRELGLPSVDVSTLVSHARAVRAAGDKLGLVSVSDLDSILTRHTADSLLFALVREPREGESWVDVGSGAGFPGMVLACCYPSTRFTLVEPQRRRAGFLELQCARLGLANVNVKIARAGQLSDSFDVGIARALADPAVALEMLHALSPDGVQILAVGDSALPIDGVLEVVKARPGIGSPGRFFVRNDASSMAPNSFQQ